MRVIKGMDALAALIGEDGVMDGDDPRAPEHAEKARKRHLPSDMIALRLKEAQAKYAETHDFKPGDLIQCKPGFAPQNISEPCIVAEILEKPIRATDFPDIQLGSNFAPDVFDMVILSIQKNDLAVSFLADSRQHEPYTGPVAEA